MISPKLRFSEFKDEWQSKKIIEIADYVDYRGKTPTKTNTGILLVTAKNIKFGYLDYETSQEFINEDDFDEVMRRGKVKIDDVLITTEAPLGNVALVDREDIALAQRVIKYCGKENISNNRFLLQKFLGEKFQEILTSKATGGTVQGIKGSVLHQIEISLPSLKEQTKIAEFLSAVDDKISQLSQQLELLNQYKKGVMQKIFSQEIRFNGFNDEWEGRKIGDFITKYVGGASFTPSDFVKKSNFEVIPKKAITARGLLRLDALNPTFSSEEFYQQNQNYTVDKTYLITTLRDLVPSGPNIGYIVSFENEKKYILAQGVYGFQTKNINRQFLIQYSNTDKFRKIMQSKLVGSTQVHIRNQDYFDTEILVPSIPEQEKIAEFLTAIDERIDHTTAQLTHTKQWKKGLLQQMFV